MAANTSGTLVIAFTVNTPVPAGTTLVANVVLIGDDGTSGPESNTGNNSGSDTTPLGVTHDLTVSKTDGGVSTTPGGTVVYTITYTNTGNVAATNVTLTETVPANTTYTGAGWACTPDANAGSTCTQNVGTVAGGASGSTTFAVTVASPVPAGVTQISNTVTIGDDGASGPESNTGNNSGSDTTPLGVTHDLTVSKTDGGVSTAPGGTVVYTINYTNTGKSARPTWRR